MCKMVRYGDKWDSAQRVEDVKLVEGAGEIIKWANDNGVLTVEVSNQPGVAKGKMTRQLSDAIEARVHSLLTEQGARVDHKYICLHHPKGIVAELAIECDCRKPKPGLILRAAKEIGIDLSKSLFLGDKASDAQAGKSAGVKTVLFIHQNDETTKVEEAKDSEADFKALSMREVNLIIKRALS